MDQMDSGALGLEQVRRPIVSVGPKRELRLPAGSFLRSALPNRTCEFPRIRLSTSSCRSATRRLCRRTSSTAWGYVFPGSDT